MSVEVVQKVLLLNIQKLVNRLLALSYPYQIILFCLPIFLNNFHLLQHFFFVKNILIKKIKYITDIPGLSQGGMKWSGSNSNIYFNLNLHVIASWIDWLFQHFATQCPSRTQQNSEKNNLGTLFQFHQNLMVLNSASSGAEVCSGWSSLLSTHVGRARKK